jgi:transcriptional regulator
MSLTTGYLTLKQKQIWNLKNKGLLEVDIARKLRVTRQTIHKVLDVANSKITQALEETARLNKIKIKTSDPSKGILMGFSSEFKTEAIITFSAKNGVQIWYKHEGDCANCEQHQACREMLLAEMEERNIQSPENLNSLSPSKLAEILFLKIQG